MEVRRRGEKNKDEEKNGKEKVNEEKDDEKKEKVEKKVNKELTARDMLTIFLIIFAFVLIAVTMAYPFYQMANEFPLLEFPLKLKSVYSRVIYHLSGVEEHSILPFNRFFMENFYNRKTKENREFYEDVRTIDFKIPALYGGDNSTQTNTELSARLYVPIKAVKSNYDIPLIVWFHDGKFNFGSYDDESSEIMCRKFAKDYQSYVISFEYRLAPEYKFPYALEDAYAALYWLNNYNHPCLLGRRYKKDFGEFLICANQSAVDMTKVFIAGEGSGGNLAISSILLWRDRSTYNIKYESYSNFPHHHQHQTNDLNIIGSILISPQIFEYPLTESMKIDHYFITNYTTHLLERNYLKEEEMSVEDFENSKAKLYKNPYLSPLSANLNTFPPSCIIVTQIDPFYQEGYHLIRQLLDNFNRELKSWRFFSMAHGFLSGDYSETLYGWGLLGDCYNSILAGDPLY